ncbi:hypothetical protein [Thioalkalivibrio sp. AKL10]|uniref:hypothetical protein n=1 Tax=Thioalkalivibrio sp. AKL10 TaxID=1158158 RepID=UPI00035E7A2A|nr:hypothetical protein [Thioalkalivibrio sp. AKL10]
MLSEAKNADLAGEWLQHIEAEDVADAFVYLVGQAAVVSGYECYATRKGDVRDFRFYRAGSTEQPFAFIVNKRWLLFYFRTPAVRTGSYTFGKLHEAFDSAAENAAGEWTVKVRSICDARRLWHLLALQ